MKQIKVYVYEVDLKETDKIKLIKTLRCMLRTDKVEVFSLKRFEELLNNDCIDLENNYVFFDMLGEVDGFIGDNEDNENDLVMASGKKKMWVNVYKVGEYFYPGDYLYEDKIRAEGNKKSAENYIGTYKIEVEV